MEIVFIIINFALILIGLIVLLLKKSSDNSTEIIANFDKKLKESFIDSRKEFREMNSENRKEIHDLIEKMGIKFSDFENIIKTDAKENRKEQNEGLKSFEEQLRRRFSDMNKQQMDINTQSIARLKEIKETIEKQLKFIREDNTTQLNEMRKTVDEKLQTTLEKRLGESFKQVSERLEQVHKGLGDMQNLATGVGDLKKVLSNVKTRGILGEYQLANILEQILAPEQYAQNVATKKGSQANVEYAIKLPGRNQDEEVWLPIDSKFPIESYNFLIESYDSVDVDNIANAQKNLIKTIESFAKDISTKYIDPPHTTDFAIMFLPVEGLYAEVLRHPGLFEKLQRNYHITITGPTTLSALLNSLQMGFHTLAVQRSSSEVWNILGAVKTEFGKFSKQLAQVHSQIDKASNSLDTLRHTRTNMMERKLKTIESIETVKAAEVLELPDIENNKNNDDEI